MEDLKKDKIDEIEQYEDAEVITNTPIPTDVNVIILNKAFEGSWNDKEGNISHEIIDFFLADNGNHYIYNSPYGSCKKDIGVFGGNNTCDKKRDKVEYLIIASSAKIIYDSTGTTIGNTNKKSSQFNIKYVIKLKQRMTDLGKTSSLNASNKSKYQKLVNNICYNGKNLFDIFNKDEVLWPLVTFEASGEMWEPDGCVQIKAKDYNYQRNLGYVYKKGNNQTFKTIYQELAKPQWKKVNLQSLNSGNSNSATNPKQKTFLDMIRKSDSEECYTNILYEIFRVPEIIDEFILYLRTFKIEDLKQTNTIKIEREKFISNGQGAGRMDLAFDGNDCRFFIENKVYSNLNGIKKGHSQITVYSEWVNEKTSMFCNENIKGFILAPDYRVNEVKESLTSFKENNMCKIITYKQIEEFLKDSNVRKILNNSVDFLYKQYIDELSSLFNKHAYASKQKKFEQDFLDAIQLANN